MARKVQEIELEMVHFIAGFSDIKPEGLLAFLDLRSDLTELKSSVDSKALIDCTKSKAKKIDWIIAFVNLPALERRALIMQNPLMIPLLPRDIKRLGLKTCKACGTKSFNPGRRTEFNVYGVFDVMSALTPKQSENAA